MSLNQYFFHREIGKGAFAQVFQGFEYKTQTPVAIKVIKAAISPTVVILITKHLKLVEKQIQILKRSNHPHIIKMKKSLRREISWYLILEYCPGGNLLDYLKKNKNLNEKQVLTIVCSIGDALRYLEKQKIVHRDIKLDNILLDSMGKVKLADFGLGKQIKDEEFLISKAGTETTMAPEIKYNNGRTQYTIKCDIWSFGVVLYEIIFGINSFQLNKNYSQKEFKIKYPNQSRIKISNQAKVLISKCLRIDPNERISAYQIMQEPWIKQYLKHSPNLVLLKPSFDDSTLIQQSKYFTENNIQSFIQQYNWSMVRAYEVLKIQYKQDLKFFRSNFQYVIQEIKHIQNKRIIQLFYKLVLLKIDNIQKIFIKFLIHAKIITKTQDNHSLNQKVKLALQKIKKQIQRDPLARCEGFQVREHFTIEQQLIYLLLQQCETTTNDNHYKQLWQIIGVIVRIIQSHMINYTIKFEYDSEISQSTIQKIEHSKRNFNKSHLDQILKNNLQNIPIQKVDLFNLKINKNLTKQNPSYFDRQILKLLEQTSNWF